MIPATACTRASGPRHAAQLARVTIALGRNNISGFAFAVVHRNSLLVSSSSSRHFSTTPVTQLRDFFPVQETAQIQTTKPAWPHHAQTREEMLAVVPAHREPRGFGEWAAWKTVRAARFWMDKATGMSRAQKTDKKNPTTSVVAQKPLTEAQWVGLLCQLKSILVDCEC